MTGDAGHAKGKARRANKRSKTGQRAGLIALNEPSTPIPISDTVNIKAMFQRLSQIHSMSGQIGHAREYISYVEARALGVYREFGLPTVSGRYWWPMGGSGWTPCDDERERQLLQAGIAGVIGDFLDIGEAAFPANSEVGFATKMLQSARLSSRLIDRAERENDIDVVKAFNVGVNIEFGNRCWREEFELGDAIAAAIKQRDNQISGGVARGKDIKTKSALEKIEYQTIADEFWAANPNKKTKGAAASHIIKRLNLDKKKDTVERLLEKPRK